MANGIRYVVEETARSAIDFAYHKAHRFRALRILRGLEQKLGKTPAVEVRRCDEYAADVLGDRMFAPWLYVYTAVSGRFKEGWIPDNFYGSAVVPALKGWYGKVSSLKPLNQAVFHSDSFPDLGSYVNGLFLDRSYRPVSPARVRDLLFAGTDRIVFKVDNSLQGRGVFFFTRETFKPEAIQKLGNGLFQSFIRQHATFDRYASHAVATLRITTVVDPQGRISPRTSYLRFGTGSDTHVRSQSHVRVPIDVASGQFSKHGYLTSWLTTEAHPDSNVPFEGEVVPSFQDCLSTVVQLHEKVPYARCVGWDVTVDEGGRPWVMEWNAQHNDIKFSEATQGPCFSDLGWEKLRPQHVPRF